MPARQTPGREMQKTQTSVGGKGDKQTILTDCLKLFQKKAQNMWNIEEGKPSSDRAGRWTAISEVLTDIHDP